MRWRIGGNVKINVGLVWATDEVIKLRMRYKLCCCYSVLTVQLTNPMRATISPSIKTSVALEFFPKRKESFLILKAGRCIWDSFQIKPQCDKLHVHHTEGTRHPKMEPGCASVSPRTAASKSARVCVYKRVRVWEIDLGSRRQYVWSPWPRQKGVGTPGPRGPDGRAEVSSTCWPYFPESG